MTHRRIPRGAKRLAPGVYAHGGGLHVDAVELCRAAGVPPTPENQDRLARVAAEVLAERAPNTQLEVRDEPYD